MGHCLFLRKGETHTAPVVVSEILNDNSWETIRKISDAGQASNYWSVGDTKSIVINGTVGAETFSNLFIDAFILGIDHNASVEGTNRIHFQIGRIDGVDVALCDAGYNSDYSASTSARFVMNTTATNVGGWNSSYMRSTIMAALKNALPSDLQAVMKSATKYTDNAGNASEAGTISATTDYLWLPAEFEVWGFSSSISSAPTGEQNYQQQYAYYAAGNSQIKYKHNATTAMANQWFRSPYGGNATDFVFTGIFIFGGANLVAYRSLGISPIFAV